MESISFRVATPSDASLIKKLINTMYGSEYEKRDDEAIEKAIENKTEFYILAYNDEACVGFSGASLNNEYYSFIITPDIAVIDYIFVYDCFRGLEVAFRLIKELVSTLLKNNVEQAIMQVQTYNKQRFFHYALCDKNIIYSTKLLSKGVEYDDQILLIEDLAFVDKMTKRDIMKRVKKYMLQQWWVYNLFNKQKVKELNNPLFF